MEESERLKELFEMNLLLCADSKYPVTTSKEEPGFLWMLECKQSNDGTYLSIGRHKTMDDNLNEDVSYCVCIGGPTFGHVFEHFFRTETLRNIEIPQITFTNDYRRHDGSRHVNIQCKVYKRVERRNLNPEKIEMGTWDFPKFLIEKETWSASFIVMLRSQYATVEYDVILNESGVIFFQTKHVVFKAVYIWGNFVFDREKYYFQLTFHPGESKKQACKVTLPAKEVVLGKEPYSINYTVFMSIHYMKEPKRQIQFIRTDYFYDDFD